MALYNSTKATATVESKVPGTQPYRVFNVDGFSRDTGIDGWRNNSSCLAQQIQHTSREYHVSHSINGSFLAQQIPEALDPWSPQARVWFNLLMTSQNLPCTWNAGPVLLAW